MYKLTFDFIGAVTDNIKFKLPKLDCLFDFDGRCYFKIKSRRSTVQGMLKVA